MHWLEKSTLFCACSKLEFAFDIDYTIFKFFMACFISMCDYPALYIYHGFLLMIDVPQLIKVSSTLLSKMMY